MKNEAAVEPVDPKSYRRIPVDVLREFYIDQVELSSLSQLAARAGLGKTTLQSFVAGAKPHPRTRRILALYYLAAQDVGPREDALDVLTAGDRRLKDAVLSAIEAYHQRGGHPVPSWVDVLKRGQ